MAGKGLKTPFPTSHTTNPIRKKKPRRRTSSPASSNHDKTRTLPNTRHYTEDRNRIRYCQSTKQTPSRQPRKRHHRRRSDKDLRSRSQRHHQRARKKPDDTTLQERSQTSRRRDRHLQEDSGPLRARIRQRRPVQEIPGNISGHISSDRKDPAFPQPISLKRDQTRRAETHPGKDRPRRRDGRREPASKRKASTGEGEEQG